MRSRQARRVRRGACVGSSRAMEAVCSCSSQPARQPVEAVAVSAAVEEAEPPHSSLAVRLDPEPEPEPEPEPHVPLPGRQGLGRMPPADDDREPLGSPTSSDNPGSIAYREAWIASEALMLAFHDDLLATQAAHARSQSQLEELRTTSAQQIESLTAQGETDAAQVVELKADVQAAEARLSLAQTQLAGLQAEHEHERGVSAGKQRQLEEELHAERISLALQGDVVVALRRVVSRSSGPTHSSRSVNRQTLRVCSLCDDRLKNTRQPSLA